MGSVQRRSRRVIDDTIPGLWVPFKVAERGIMSGFAVLGFVFTLGAGRDWSASALEEGCVHKWLIEADDLRPAPTSHP